MKCYRTELEKIVCFSKEFFSTLGARDSKEFEKLKFENCFELLKFENCFELYYYNA